MSDWKFDQFDPPDISHLHEGDRNRVKAGEYDAREWRLLQQGQNPWAKSGKPEPLKQAEPTGTRVPGQVADDKSPPRDREPTEAELLEFMLDGVRQEYESSEVSDERKKHLREIEVEQWKEARKRRQERLRQEHELTRKALALRHEMAEDPNNADDLPPASASIPELHKWYHKRLEDMQRPAPHVPFPVSEYQPPDPVKNIALSTEDNLRTPEEIQVRLHDDLMKIGDAVSSPVSDPNDKPWHKRGDLVLAVVLALGAAVLGIVVLLLPPKSVSTVIFWLTLMFVLLAAALYIVARYRDWSWLKTAAGVIVMAVVVLVFGWFAWPEPTLDRHSEKATAAPQSQPTNTLETDNTAPKRIIYFIKGDSADLRDAEVKAYHEQSEYTFEGYIDNQGEIRIKDLPGGFYVIFVNHPKFGKFQGRTMVPLDGMPKGLPISDADATVTLERMPY